MHPHRRESRRVIFFATASFRTRILTVKGSVRQHQLLYCFAMLVDSLFSLPTLVAVSWSEAAMSCVQRSRILCSVSDIEDADPTQESHCEIRFCYSTYCMTKRVGSQNRSLPRRLYLRNPRIQLHSLAGIHRLK
jgi:hypothetical protein